MADWKTHYREHLVTMDVAAKSVNSGDALWLGAAGEVPYSFLEKLHERMEDLQNVALIYTVFSKPIDLIFDVEAKKHFKMVSFFTLPLERISAEMGIVSLWSNSFEFIPRAALEVYKCNTVALNVCPPDEDGYCTMGIYGSSTTGLIANDDRITKTIAVIDRNQSPAGGNRSETSLKVTSFDYIVECDEVPFEVPGSIPTELDQKLVEYVVPFIHDGDKLQIGYGGLGDAVLASLDHLNSIEIYSEVVSEAMQPLVEKGIVSKLSFASCGVGSPSFFNFLATNEKVHVRDVTKMIDPFGISAQDNIVAVNSTFMVDLTGQACSEAQGINQYSAVGGQFSYLYGAMKSKGGRSLLCLRSTYTDHDGVRHSNVVAWLPEKSVVTAPRYLTMYIVSEFGVADVFLKAIKDRIKALLKIAHPDFRKELKEQIISTGQIAEDDFDE